MALTHDYIVVGSGATGAIAARALTEAGADVAVLDVGVEDDQYRGLIPNRDFSALRQSDEQQHVYMLGKRFEGIPWDTSKVGSQLTPPREYLVRLTDELIPFESATLKPMESLARGGLGGGWGLGCYRFSKAELAAMGLDECEMQPAYESVAAHIGISGAHDDGAPYCLGDLTGILPPPDIEENLRGLYEAYRRKRTKLNAKGVLVGRSALALLTREMDDRGAVQYNDMEFWSDDGKAAYRSWMTLDTLAKNSNFTYHPNCLVLHFHESDGRVELTVRRSDTHETQVFTCRRLILAAGVLGTARIVIRSFGYRADRLPLICNPYCYIPCVQWRRLGTATERFKTSLGQLVVYVDEDRNNFDVAMAALFSYRSLLLFKLIKELPVDFADARVVMQYLQSSFTIAGIHHPERPGPAKFVRMRRDAHTVTGDILTGHYALSDDEIELNKRREDKLRWALRQLGCQPIRTVRTPHGGSIHYAGTLPFGEGGAPYTLLPDGRLGGTRSVFVADGSGFKYLPAKGLTLTLMANAHRVANHALAS